MNNLKVLKLAFFGPKVLTFFASKVGSSRLSEIGPNNTIEKLLENFNSDRLRLFSSANG